MMTIISLIVPIGMVIGWVILLVIAWRFMKAHEAIANTYKSLESMMRELMESIKAKD